MGLRISGAGCSLIDYLYTNIDFSENSLQKYFSRMPGDGGITPGKLVFADEFEQFCGTGFLKAIEEVTGGREPDALNLGGPAIVALINTAQLLHGKDVDIGFYGSMGKDDTGERIIDIISKTPVNIDHYIKTDSISPSTIVLSDPNYDNGNGERAFINNIGAAWNIRPEDLGESFFDTDIVLFGATGLVPRLHDGLTGLCRRAKQNGCITVVSTVFDFRNEKKGPDKRWPLGENDETYRLTDLLITDREEALRLSGMKSTEDAVSWFRDRGVGALIVTCGAENLHIYSRGNLFLRQKHTTLPISEQVGIDIREGRVKPGDTTGCGDNFVGGVIASVAEQYSTLKDGRNENINLVKAAAWGVASGGFACLHVGGTYLEDIPGEKREKIERYYSLYLRQVGR